MSCCDPFLLGYRILLLDFSYDLLEQQVQIHDNIHQIGNSVATLEMIEFIICYVLCIVLLLVFFFKL